MSFKHKIYSLSDSSILISIMLHIAHFFYSSQYRNKTPFICVSNQWHLKVSLSISRVIPNFFSRRMDAYFSERNIFFLINNIPDSIGHCYGEVDYASRYIIENKDAKLIFIFPKYKMLVNISRLVRHDVAERIFFLLNGALCIFMYPLILTFDKCLLDLSLGQYDLTTNTTMSYGDFWNVKYRKHVEMVNRTGPSTLMVPINKDIEMARRHLFAQLDLKEKYVVIQIKDSVVNATFSPTDPFSLIPALEWLKTNGYDLVQGGREDTPNCFKKLGVKTYSSMKIASSLNDAILYSSCCMAISSGSGVNNIPSKLGKPQLILNVWNFGYVVEIVNLVWPTRLVKSKTNELISLEDQFRIIKDWDPTSSERIYKDFDALDANADDIINALKELVMFLEHGKWVKSKQKEKFYSKFKQEVFAVQQSQIANRFIEKYYETNLK